MILVVKSLDRARVRPICESKMLDPTTRPRKEVCDRHAAYTVNGTAMCRRHAGSFLVDALADWPDHTLSPKSTFNTEEK